MVLPPCNVGISDPTVRDQTVGKRRLIWAAGVSGVFRFDEQKNLDRASRHGFTVSIAKSASPLCLHRVAGQLDADGDQHRSLVSPGLAQLHVQTPLQSAARLQ